CARRGAGWSGGRATGGPWCRRGCPPRRTARREAGRGGAEGARRGRARAPDEELTRMETRTHRAVRLRVATIVPILLAVLHVPLGAQDRLRTMPGYARYQAMAAEIPG